MIDQSTLFLHDTTQFSVEVEADKIYEFLKSAIGSIIPSFVQEGSKAVIREIVFQKVVERGEAKYVKVLVRHTDRAINPESDLRNSIQARFGLGRTQGNNPQVRF